MTSNSKSTMQGVVLSLALVALLILTNVIASGI